jgi:hypothetical protein
MRVVPARCVGLVTVCWAAASSDTRLQQRIIYCWHMHGVPRRGGEQLMKSLFDHRVSPAGGICHEKEGVSRFYTRASGAGANYRSLTLHVYRLMHTRSTSGLVML